MAKPLRLNNTHQNEFIKEFNKLCQTRNIWEVWADFIVMAACSLANNVFDPDREDEVWRAREKEYEECKNRMGGEQSAVKLLSILVNALNSNPEQDFLGNIFMALELGNHWKGQFFTPYSVCKMMSEITVSDKIQTIESKGYITINDCACGAGATLIATANAFLNHKINYQTSAWFVAQDVDRIAGLMCYIQLSVLGCAGYVVIADSICNPVIGEALIPVQKENQEFWFMPMSNRFIWQDRIRWKILDMLFSRKT